MTRLDKMREEVKKLNFKIGHHDKYVDVEMEAGLSDEDLDRIFKVMADGGAVMEVECPDCVWAQFKEGTVGMTPCYHCNSTGYMVEPLIKEQK